MKSVYKPGTIICKDLKKNQSVHFCHTILWNMRVVIYCIEVMDEMELLHPDLSLKGGMQPYAGLSESPL